jgi:hypothetical protein
MIYKCSEGQECEERGREADQDVERRRPDLKAIGEGYRPLRFGVHPDVDSPGGKEVR